MKKILLFSTFLFSLFLFLACDFESSFVDEVAVHNDLVDRMDAVLQTEEAFYDVYLVLFDGDEVDEIKSLYEEFSANVDALDAYFTNTTFAEGQLVFVEEYNDYYKPFLGDYVSYAGEFVTALETDGVTMDVMTPFIEDLDTYTYEFIDIHNRLIETINLQSDFDSDETTFLDVDDVPDFDLDETNY